MVLVSQRKTKANTEQYFSDMPWTAMAHEDLMGSRGQELMAKFGVHKERRDGAPHKERRDGFKQGMEQELSRNCEIRVDYSTLIEL